MPRILLACSLVLVLPLWAIADDFQRGCEAMSKGDYELAIACFNAYIRDNPNDARAYHSRGAAYNAKKEHDKAIKDYSEAIRLDPKLAAAYLTSRGATYLEKKEYDKAIEDFSDVIRLAPKSAGGYVNRARAYRYKKEYDKAIRDCSEAIRLDSNIESFSYNERAVTNTSKKEYDKAIKDFSEAIRLDPKYADAYSGYAWLLATCPKDSVRDGNKAIKLATKACELSDWKSAAFLDTLAAAHAEANDFKDAVKCLNKALDLGDDTDELRVKYRQRLKLYQAGKPYRDD